MIYRCLVVVLLLSAVSQSVLAAAGSGGDQSPAFATPIWAPDVYGGYASDRITISMRAGSADPATSPGSALQALNTKWSVTGVRPLYPHPFQHPDLAAKHGLDRLFVIDVPPGTDTLAMVAEYSAGVADVEAAEVDGIGGVAAIPNDPAFSDQFALNNTGQSGGTVDADIDAVEAWDIETGMSNLVTVAVIDSGVYPHGEFADRMLQGTNTTSAGGSTTDSCNHGTHVTGTILASGNNGNGIAGLSWGAWVLPVRVLNGCLGTESECAIGIAWAADNGADICNMSVQYYAGTAALQGAVNYAHDAGVLLIAASGNQQGNVVSFPARFPHCMGVGATDQNDAHPAISNTGPEVDLVAPGINIYSTAVNGTYYFGQGTSMATPHVSGTAALLKSYAPDLSAAEIEDVLVTTVDDLGSPGFDTIFGHGRLNAYQALLAADRLHFEYPDGAPELLVPNMATSFPVRIIEVGAAAIVAGSPMLLVSTNGEGHAPTALLHLHDDVYEATLPAVSCLDAVQYYISANMMNGPMYLDPPNAPVDGYYEAIGAVSLDALFTDTIEAAVDGWTIVNDPGLTAGAWEQADPVGTSFQNRAIAPFDDASVTGDKAFVTQNGLLGGGVSLADIDGGPTQLISPQFDLTDTDAIVSFAAWVATVQGTPDVMNVLVSNNGGAAWTPVETIADTDSKWRRLTFRVGAFITPTAQVRVMFRAADLPNDSYTEAGIDDFEVAVFNCATQTPPMIVASDPPNNARDARQPSEPSGASPTAWQTIDLTFDAPMDEVNVGDFAVTQSTPGPAPSVASVTPNGNHVIVLLSHGIATLAWTMITHLPSGTSTRIGFLPGDVNDDGVSNANDVLSLINSVNGVIVLPLYKTDANQSNVANATDVLRVIDLLNGAETYPPFLGAALPQ